MSRFSSIDLSQLPAPDVVDRLDFEGVLADLMADVNARFTAIGVDYDVGNLETDPAKIILEVAAYRELILRALINDKARAVMLAFAGGADLDNLAAFYATSRLDGESDAAFRARVQIAPEALSVAGPVGAYAYHAFKVSPQIVDVAVFSPSPGSVHVVPLVSSGNGQPSDDLIGAVAAVLTDDAVRPLTDNLVVRKPRPVAAPITAQLIVGRGPDLGVVKAAAQAALDVHLTARRRIGRTLYLSGIVAALKVGGVEDVILSGPVADVPAARDEIVIARPVTLTAARMAD
jgi:phage-related baseplate assembly protein